MRGSHCRPPDSRDSHRTPAQPSIGSLENPIDGGTYSGIGLISGFHCGTNDLKVVIDEGTANEKTLVPAYGTERNDTQATCGQTDTGFGLLWNYALFSSGTHTAQAYANGTPFGAASSFDVVRLDETKAFVRDLTGSLSHPRLSDRWTIHAIDLATGPTELSHQWVQRRAGRSGRGTLSTQRDKHPGQL